MCSCHSILECCVTFSGVKLSIRSFVLFPGFVRDPYRITLELSGDLNVISYQHLKDISATSGFNHSRMKCGL